jgi:hypothetical protein
MAEVRRALDLALAEIDSKTDLKIASRWRDQSIAG